MLKNKRILITQPIIRGFNGSTLLTLELADALQKIGAKVTLYTCNYAKPASTFFQKANLHVDTLQDNPDYKLSDFDYIWIHSQILPTSIIKDLSYKHSKIPSFIFLHMSGMDWIPDEKPWIYNLENQLSGLSLFISEEVLEVNKPFLDSSIPTAFFRNPAPKEYLQIGSTPSPNLQKLLIVSNHPPKEVLEAKKILIEKYHLNVSILGESQDKYTLMSPSILNQYDAVRAIAKTVPYCLLANKPVYIYDAFGGGPGWLNKNNYNQAKYRNFSGYQNHLFPNYEGKCFSFKKPEQISQEIINGYKDALLFQTSQHEEFIQDFSLEQVIPNIFQSVQQRNITPFPKSYTESVIASQLFAFNRFEAVSLLYERDANINHLLKEVNKLRISNTTLSHYKKSAEAVFSSRAYRLFNQFIKPYQKIKYLQDRGKKP